MIERVELDECGSTNDEAWKLAPPGSGKTVLVSSRRQLRGRGRQGRVWRSGSGGNILASLAMPAPERNLGWLPLAAGVAAIEAIRAACRDEGCRFARSGLRLKWPNDIMWREAKMGGILCESRILGEAVAGVVVGMGLNVVAAPEIGETATTFLLDHLDPRPADIREKILSGWPERLVEWRRKLSDGDTLDLRARWKKAARLGTYATFRAHDREGKLVALRAVDLDQMGRLKARITGTGKLVALDQSFR